MKVILSYLNSVILMKLISDIVHEDLCSLLSQKMDFTLTYNSLCSKLTVVFKHLFYNVDMSNLPSQPGVAVAFYATIHTTQIATARELYALNPRCTFDTFLSVKL